MNRTAYWKSCIIFLKRLFLDKGITTCEIKFPGCWNDNTLGFAHLHKRNWYLGQAELLKDFNQVVLACTSCHQKIEGNEELTKKVFNRLRG